MAKPMKIGTLAALARAALADALTAARPDVELDADGYVTEPEQSLVPGVPLADALRALDADVGDAGTRLRAPWSSTALVLNSFAPWQREPGLLAVGASRHSRP